MQRFLRAAFSLCLMAALCAHAQSLEVIDLKYRTAEEVIPVLQPLLERGGALSGQHYKLFVRASPANLSQLRAVLAQIDRQPRQLIVSVRKSAREEIERERMQASGTLRSDGGSLSVDETSRSNSGATVSATGSSVRTQTGGIASLQVTEGSSAFIASGSSVPIVTAVAGGGGRRPWVAAATAYRNLGSGFLVTPRVGAEQVVLDISQQDERLADGGIRTQRLSTQVSGRLGEWIQLGGIGESSARTHNRVLGRQHATRSDERSLWVKVEVGGL